MLLLEPTAKKTRLAQKGRNQPYKQSQVEDNKSAWGRTENHVKMRSQDTSFPVTNRWASHFKQLQKRVMVQEWYLLVKVALLKLALSSH